MRLGLFLVLLVLSACMPLLTPDCPACPETECMPQICPERPACEDAVEPYYEAVFIMCNIANLRTLKSWGILLFDCDEMVRDAYEREWHKKDAPNFEWPPESPVPTPTSWEQTG